MKLAIVGCGNIAEYHVPVLRAVGFEIRYIASSMNSKSVEKFSKKHNIEQIYNNPVELIKSNKFP